MLRFDLLSIFTVIEKWRYKRFLFFFLGNCYEPSWFEEGSAIPNFIFVIFTLTPLCLNVLMVDFIHRISQFGFAEMFDINYLFLDLSGVDLWEGPNLTFPL